jgi:hypothetical protein
MFGISKLHRRVRYLDVENGFWWSQLLWRVAISMNDIRRCVPEIWLYPKMNNIVAEQVLSQVLSHSRAERTISVGILMISCR